MHLDAVQGRGALERAHEHVEPVLARHSAETDVGDDDPLRRIDVPVILRLVLGLIGLRRPRHQQIDARLDLRHHLQDRDRGHDADIAIALDRHRPLPDLLASLVGDAPAVPIVEIVQEIAAVDLAHQVAVVDAQQFQFGEVYVDGGDRHAGRSNLRQHIGLLLESDAGLAVADADLHDLILHQRADLAGQAALQGHLIAGAIAEPVQAELAAGRAIGDLRIRRHAHIIVIGQLPCAENPAIELQADLRAIAVGGGFHRLVMERNGATEPLISGARVGILRQLDRFVIGLERFAPALDLFQRLAERQIGRGFLPRIAGRFGREIGGIGRIEPLAQPGLDLDQSHPEPVILVADRDHALRHGLRRFLIGSGRKLLQLGTRFVGLEIGRRHALNLVAIFVGGGGERLQIGVRRRNCDEDKQQAGQASHDGGHGRITPEEIEEGCSRTELDQKARLFSMFQPHPVIFAFDFGVFWAERSNHP